MTFSEKPVAVVTGGGSGIGAAICEVLAQRGVAVMVADINELQAQQIAQHLRSCGLEAQAVPVDVSDAQQMQQLIAQVVEQFGRLDYMVNNAGLALVAEMVDMTLDWWQKIVGVNFWGVLYGTDAAYRVMIKQGFGHIINVASGAGLIPAPFRVAYTATKHAVVGLSLALRAEAALYQVKVSVVCPGTVRTPIFNTAPLINFNPSLVNQRISSQKMTEPDMAARIILRGVDRNQAIVTFPVMMRVIWWAYRLFPGLIEKTLLEKFTVEYRKMQVR